MGSYSLSFNKRLVIGLIGIVVFYVLTIPIRDYGFLNVDVVTFWIHLLLVFGVMVGYSVLLVLVSFLSREKLKGRAGGASKAGGGR